MDRNEVHGENDDGCQREDLLLGSSLDCAIKIRKPLDAVPVLR